MIYSRLKNIPSIEGSIIATPLRVLLVCLMLVAISYLVYAEALFSAKNLTLQAGPPVGGDFVAFWGAARAAMQGLAAEIYQIPIFESFLMENAMPRERFGLTWQYPPTYYLLIAPLAFLPFMPAYVLWSGGALIVFLLIMKRTQKLGLLGVFVLFATPVMFNSVITGQNGFLTASLLTLAACLPDRRPLIAGLAAGLLTFKPQLGVLLPIAFLAAGCWRAFFVAAITALVMVGTSVLAFGPEAWSAFFDSILSVSEGVQGSIYPIHKMPTVFAAFHKTGLSSTMAMSMQLLAALATMGFVGFIWRRVKDQDLRAAVLCAAVFLCTPYAYYYEMTILVLPAVVIVKRAMQDGWLKGEEILISIAFFMPLILPGLAKYAGAQIGLATVLMLLFLSTRRALQSAPQPQQAFATTAQTAQA